MILIIGGAYQGKLDYVKKRWPEKTIYQCNAQDPGFDLSSDVINSLHLMVLAQVNSGVDTRAYLQARVSGLNDKVIISDDISSGVVPVDPEMRQWREALGRSLAMLAEQADEVIRVFCGIASRIK